MDIPSHTCKTPGCKNICRVQPNGSLYDHCCKACANNTKCSRSDCFRTKYIENGKTYDFCGKTCARSGSSPMITYNHISLCHETSTMILFYHESCPFSQWSKHSFTHDNIKYKTAEHFMMYKKAILMGDIATGNMILKSPGPAEAKKLGRLITGFDQSIWNSKKRETVMMGNILKFQQNSDILMMLCDTGRKRMVEAAGNDLVWGCGYRYDNPLIHDPNNWRGENLLGEILNDVRDICVNFT